MRSWCWGIKFSPSPATTKQNAHKIQCLAGSTKVKDGWLAYSTCSSIHWSLGWIRDGISLLGSKYLKQGVSVHNYYELHVECMMEMGDMILQRMTKGSPSRSYPSIHGLHGKTLHQNRRELVEEWSYLIKLSTTLMLNMVFGTEINSKCWKQEKRESE